ncbi:MAG: hypothetical protein M0P09_01425 [Acholeplasmataceae bacterium]|nr:hypothetical protein [Acholeplasmataceae bacterium]
MKSDDHIVELNVDLLRQRSRVGIKKYGVTLEQSGLSQKQFMRHALEEVLDLANYLQGALQSQDREDAERLDWLAEQEAQIQSLALANGTRYRLGWPDDGEAQSEWFKSPREAVDHARSIEGGGE